MSKKPIKKMIDFLWLAAIFALLFGSNGTFAVRAQAGGGSGNSSSTPASVIPHPNHNYKHICDRTKVRGMNHCDSDIITDTNGKSLVIANSLISPQTLQSAPYGPAQFRGAYGVSGTTSITRTVAIVDAYNDPTVLSDLNTYSSAFSIPTISSCAVSGGTYSSPCFQVVNENGGSTLPPSDGQGVNGWAGEISLDVQSVHAMCQNCNILLVEATSASDYDLIEVADQTAVSMGANVVSNSWGECESGPNCEGSGETSLDSYFNHPGVPFVFSSGDGAYLDGTQYPAASPYVTAVGGTSLYLNSDNSYNSETVWFTSPIEGAGSGCSAYEPKPSFQHDSGCSKRTVADVSADADPNTGAYVYVTDPVNRTGFYGIGGTSLAAPLVSSIYALAGGVGATNGNSLPYANLSYGVNLHDVTSGSNGICSSSYLCTAGTGYDGPTGLGTPKGTMAFAATMPPVAVFRPNNSTWYIRGVGATQYGTNGDIPVPADYTGAGHLQLAVFRPSNGKWYINGMGATLYGQNGDIPVPADYTGVGHAQLAVFRPSNDIWYIYGVGATQYGDPTKGDIPVPADYTGAGHTQLAVFRPTNDTWYIYGVGATQYGDPTKGDIPVPADYTGAGHTQLAVFRPTNGIWYIYGVGGYAYGTNGDIPVPADYTGAGHVQLAVFRPSNGTWYIYGVGGYAYGTNGDIPVPGHYQ